MFYPGLKEDKIIMYYVDSNGHVDLVCDNANLSLLSSNILTTVVGIAV